MFRAAGFAPPTIVAQAARLQARQRMFNYDALPDVEQIAIDLRAEIEELVVAAGAAPSGAAHGRPPVAANG